MFTFASALKARPATPGDRYAIQALMRYEQRVHMHLDWQPVEEWLGTQPFIVAERRGRVVGALVCPPDLPDVAWIRLIALADGVEASQVWEVLWTLARRDLAQQPGLSVAGLSLAAWTVPLYEAAGFGRTHEVVTLRRSLARPVSARFAANGRRPPIIVRLAEERDHAAILRTDAAAFVSPWRLSPATLHAALAQADHLTLAEQDGRVVGYQLTTADGGAAHLARLAVIPEAQGRGIGSALVAETLEHYQRRGRREITVNTQHDNKASLAVYRRLGFELTGERMPVYQLML
ncbi:MAG: GNAT family N-acetyltransferase [Anaerolineales bacterium]|nr:GNAT family N-acetyltransferase [Anaerolineales bacterium]